jgi:hypothetical protein
MVSLEAIRANKHTQWEEASTRFMHKIVCFLQKELPDCKGISYMKTKEKNDITIFLKILALRSMGFFKKITVTCKYFILITFLIN